MFLSLAVACSDGASDTDTPLGSAGTSSGVAGNGTGVAGSVGTAGSVATAGTSSGVAGTVGTGGSGVAGSGTAGAATAGTGGAAAGSGTGGSGGSGLGGGSSGGSGGGTAGAGQAGSGGGGTMPTDGKGLYDLNCKACHGEQGIGGALGPEIQHPVREYSSWVVRNGRALISPWPKAMEKMGTDKVSDAQLTLIWDYLDQPPQQTTQQGLYSDYCANCHGADGKGGPVTRPLANEEGNVDKLVRNGKSVGNYSMRHDSMPKFDTMRITDAQLALIKAQVTAF